MSPLVFAALALAGGAGAVCRFVLDGIVRSRVRARLPIGTILINVTGSLLLGLVVGAVSAGLLPHEVQLIVGVGFLGGYTTFSTASFETVRLVQERRWLGALMNGLGVIVVATAAAGLGLWIGSSLATA
ncbi:MAG: fluoride efflux transporter CrcB [Actinobacteria bacterium]|nr:fluoride efflux transporter CrcB [Actinomycetota bacterium]